MRSRVCEKRKMLRVQNRCREGVVGIWEKIFKKGVDKPRGSEYTGKCAVNER
jgi:hypothetical protein